MSEYDTIDNTIDNYDIDSTNKNNTFNKKSKLKTICSFILVIILILSIVLYILFYNYIDIDVSISVNSTLLPFARFPMHHHHHHKITCDDYKYGCCEVSDNRGNTYTLSLHRIHKYDEYGTNCPTFNKLIHNYNDYIEEYYSDKIINCIHHKCCDKYDIIIPTKDCPSPYKIIYTFNQGYTNPNVMLYLLLIVLSMVLIWNIL